MHPARKSIAEADGLKTNSRFPEVLQVDSVCVGDYKYTDALIDILIVRYYKLAKIKPSLTANEETAGDFFFPTTLFKKNKKTLLSVASLSGPRLFLLK